MASLRTNFSWILSGSVVYAASNWGVLSVFAHTSTPEHLGYFAYGLAIANPVFSLLSLNLRGLHASDSVGEFHFPHLLAAKNVATILALLIMGIVAVATSGPTALKATIILVSIGKAFDASVNLLLGYYQRRQNMKMLSFAQSANGILSLAFCSVLLSISGGDPILGALGYAGGSAMSSRLFWAAAKRRERKVGHMDIFRPIFDRRALKKIVSKGLPLGAANSVSAANTAVLRHALAASAGMDSLGIFSALSYALVPMSMTTNALGQAALPRLADARQRSPGNLIRQSVRLVSLALLIGASASGFALALGEPFLLIFFGPEYSGNSTLLFELSLAGIFSCGASVFTYILLGAGATRVQIAIALVGLLLTSISSAVLIPRYQIYATPLVIGISSLSQLLFSAVTMAYILKRQQPTHQAASQGGPSSLETSA